LTKGSIVEAKGKKISSLYTMQANLIAEEVNSIEDSSIDL